MRIQGTALEATARANGTFEISEVPVGSYTIRVSFVAHAVESTLVHVHARETSTIAVQLRLSIPPRPVQTFVTGTTVDALTGEPLPEVHVVGIDTSRPGEVLEETRTDFQGQYALAMNGITHLVFTAAMFDTLQLSLALDRKPPGNDCCCGVQMKEAQLNRAR